MEMFALWLFGRYNQRPAGDNSEPGSEINRYITVLVSIMGKFANFYTRKIFRNSELHSLDDYVVLLILQYGAKLSKSELMRQALMEKSYGTEVIKRLLKQAFIREVKNAADKREKHVAITKAGIAQVTKFAESIAKLSDHVVGNLNQPDKLELLKMLQHLNDFHLPYFDPAKDGQMDELLGINLIQRD
jgi:DNA-binding MarR family transcriptional regulator